MKEEREVENNEEAKGGFLGCLQGTVAIFLLAYGLYVLATI